ncbi:calvin cycle protein CP12-1, chloroplastic-like [Punica granatum]|uniref:CP12 domain-containing protein n=2 Tax=Punica granatum TaxID=22663 RepID=A0A218X6C7_PUNGR|nr:calvin cycle protein CP12-1, chloroplastic-like [Punica granatum]OWM80061.1 hypothetical protein CDL15_Pgr010039 [Punica granatum]PKI70292.1 hypothetical protein CRG98_009321 [Punica granatum]
MATITGVNLPVVPKGVGLTSEPSSRPLALKASSLSCPWKRPIKVASSRKMRSVVVAAAPDRIEKVAESIKEAEEACAGGATSGECAAAWDEVEELSAAASHAKERKKESDPLETFCKDNPETDECRTYDN